MTMTRPSRDMLSPAFFDSAADFSSDTKLAYSGSGKRIVSLNEEVEIGGFRLNVVSSASGSESYHQINKNGVKVAAKHLGNRIEAEAFGAVGDGETDDIEALERWVEYVEANGLIGVLSGKTYMVSRTLYMTARGGYEGCENAVVKATSDFVTTFEDPHQDHLASNLAPVMFYDGRIQAVGNPTRKPYMQSIKADGGGVAAHGQMFVGVLPASIMNCSGGNTTLERFVFCGLQNATIFGLKSEALSSGLTMSDSAAVAILNGMKNSQFIGCDFTGVTVDAEAIVRIGTDASYPGPGNSASPIAEYPSLLQFYGGVWETQGDSEEPRRAVHITHGDQIDFYGVNLALQPLTAMIEVEEGVNNVRFRGGRSNALGGTGRFLKNLGRDTVIDRHYISGFDTTNALFENNENGRVYFIAADNGFFPKEGTIGIFDGTASHHQNHYVPPRWFGNEAARDDVFADAATGVQWWSADHMQLEYVVDGNRRTPDGILAPSGTEDVASWPVLTDADVSGGILDLKGYPRVTLKLSSSTNVTGMTAQQYGQKVSIVCDNANPTFVSGAGLKTMDRANYTPQSRDVLTFERVNGSNLTGGLSEWVQTGGPCTALLT